MVGGKEKSGKVNEESGGEGWATFPSPVVTSHLGSMPFPRQRFSNLIDCIRLTKELLLKNARVPPQTSRFHGSAVRC